MRPRGSSLAITITVLALALLVTACAEASPRRQAGASRSDRPDLSSDWTLGDLDRPPPVTVHAAGRSIELQPWSYCFGNVCADGFPPDPPPDVGSPEELLVEFPFSGWSFTASFRPAGSECGRVQQVPLEATDGGRFVLEPAGHPGTYDVDLFGAGDGDVIVTFRWRTPRGGPLPRPEARLAVLADHDRGVDSYGVELEVTNLAADPKQASATITVRARSGGHVRRHPQPCHVPPRRDGVLGRSRCTGVGRLQARRGDVRLRGRARARRRPVHRDLDVARGRDRR
jgi:hypothetical protein